MNFELISIIVVYSFIFFIIYKNRKKIQIMDKIFFVYKWDKGVDLIKKLSKKFFKIIFTIGIPISFFFMLFGIKAMIDGAMNIALSPAPEPTVGIVIPGIRIPGSPFYVPFWYGIISLAIIIFFHELSHGISATIEKIKLKSTGIGLLLFLPIAFVEPEIKSYEKSSNISKIRMLIAGSFANISIAFLCFLIIIFLMTPLVNSMIDYNGVTILSSAENEPAHLAGVINNSKILMINNESINDLNDFHYSLSNINPGEKLILTTNYSEYEIIASSNPNNDSLAYLGVFVNQEWNFKESLNYLPNFILNLPLIFSELLMWVSNLNFAIGIINLYPLWITDGGKIIIELLYSLIKNKRKANIIANNLFLIFFGILLFNLIGPFLINSINSIF